MPGHHDESGFTLLELLISIVVLGIIASGVAASIILFFRTADGTSNRLALSHDSQLLANYLVPDLDSLTAGGLSESAPASTVNPCPSGFSAFQDLGLNFTDAHTQQGYQVDYRVTGASLIRTASPPGQPATTVTVVHNLKPGGACFTKLAISPWTMNITVEAKGDPSTDYNFSITGGGRITIPPASSPPGFVSAVSTDTNRDSKVDEIVVTFDQPLNVNDSAGTTGWTVQPAAVALTSVSISGDAVVLRLDPATTHGVDALLTVALTQQADGVRNGANQLAAFGTQPVRDGVAAVPTEIVAEDTDGDGIDQLVVTFSKALCTGGPLCPNQPSTRPWQLVSAPAGLTFNTARPILMSGKTVALPLTEETSIDTSAPGLKVKLLFDPLGVIDSNGNVSSFEAMSVADGAPPVPVSALSEDTAAEGKINQVVVTFSEPLVTKGAVRWSLTRPPDAGVTLRSVTVSGTTATLVLNEGTTHDTAAQGFALSLEADPNGIQDASGNQSSFANLPVTDGMGPVVIGIASTNVAGGTANAMDQGDTLTLTFSEPVLATSLPANPTVTLSPQSNGTEDSLSISGVATIDLGSSHNSSAVTFGASLTVSGPNVVVVLGSPMGGPQGLTPGPNLIVTPLPTVTDGAPEPNHAVGRFSISPMALF